jgi:DNA-binding transcriptional MerR regulator
MAAQGHLTQVSRTSAWALISEPEGLKALSSTVLTRNCLDSHLGGGRILDVSRNPGDDEGARGMEEISIGEFARRSRLSVKALRLYDELGVLAPARVDRNSGYRYYDAAQLEAARLIAMLRQLEFPLAAIKELLACDPVDAAELLAARWRKVESTHDAQRELADYLINLLRGKRPVMYEVATREIPERSVLCLKRNVDEQGAWALGKEFIAILRERPLPKMEGREGAMFSIYWGEVSADSDGPVEWCKPVPEADAKALASHYPELSLRIEPSHGEAYVAIPNGAIPAGPGENPGVHWQLASEALQSWAKDQDLVPEHLDRTPEDLGVRITYFSSEPVTETSAPYCDFAVPFAPTNS